MDTAPRLVERDGTADDMPTPLISGLVLVLLILVVSALSLVGLLYVLRRRRNARRDIQLLPTYNHENSNRGRFTISATPWTRKTQPIHVHEEKRNLIENSSSPPDSTVPEIRITFPDGDEPSGTKNNGHVVVVRIGDCGSVGMEPVAQHQLPPYQPTGSERFQSLDLERIGGLKETGQPNKWS